MKKLLLLTIVLLFTLPGLSQIAFEYEYKGQLFICTVLNEEDKTVEILPANYVASGNVEIPSVAYLYSTNNDPKPYTVTKIKSHAFLEIV